MPQWGMLGDLLPEPLLIVSREGTIVAVNRAARDAMLPAGREPLGTALCAFVREPAETLDAYLRACARTPDFVPGSLTIGSGSSWCEYRADGARYAAGGSGERGPVLLRLAPKAAAENRFLALNRRLDELGGELARRARAEAALQESEARFRGMMEQAPFSIQIFSPDGRTVAVNRAWSELWGISPADIAAYKVLEDPQLEASGVRPYLVRAFAGEPVTIPAIKYDLDATLPGVTRHADPVRWVSAVAYPLKDAAGVVELVVLVHEDVTARMQSEAALRSSEENLRLLADTIPQLAWMAGPDGYITWYNSRWYEYTGTNAESMQGWGWQSVHDPKVLPAVLTEWNASIASGEPFEMVFPLRAADGTFRPFLTRVNPLRNEDGQVLYWFGTNTDVSEIKRMEAALLDADRRKDEFLATLAHELRNPLAPISNSLQILKMPRLDPAIAEQTRDMIGRQVQHLVRLVDDLLDVSRVMQGKIYLRTELLELSTVIARAVEMAQPLIDAQGHRVDISLAHQPLLIQADPVRLCQVLANVLTNAAKFTPRQGLITISGCVEEGRVVVRVRDNGMGISGEALPRVFDLFVQADGTMTQAHGGLGIGLTLARSLVELHGGTIGVYSAGLGKGAEFTVRLPLTHARRAQESTSANAAVNPATSAHRLLVVDDNEDAAESLAMLLRLQGHDVRVAYDGESALCAAGSHLPGLIFLDLGMPGIDGYEVVRRLRETPGPVRPYIVALTGWGQEEDRRRTAAAGFDCHLVKPPRLEAIQELLARLG